MAVHDTLAAFFHGMERGVERFDRTIERLSVDLQRAGGGIHSVTQKLAVDLTGLTNGLRTALEATRLPAAIRALTSALDSPALRAGLERLGAAVGTVLAPLVRLAPIISGVVRSAIAGAGGAIGALAAGAGTVGGYARQAISTVNNVSGAVTAPVGRMAQESVSTGVSVASETISKTTGDLTIAFSALGGAASGVVGALTSIPNQLASFVQAFSPATMERFMLMIREVTAVFGIAFEPIITAFTDLAEEVGSQLKPVMEQLRPIIEQLAGDFLQRLTPVIRLFANILITLMPVIQLFADLMSALTPLIQASVAVFGAFMQALASFFVGLFGGDTAKNAMDSLKKAIFEVAKGLVLFAAYLGKFFGMDTFVKALKDNLGSDPAKKKDDLIGTAAATNASYSSISEYGKSITLAATVASGKKPEETQEDIWKGMRERLDKIANGTDTLEDLLLKKVVPALVAGLLGNPTTDKQTYINKGARAISGAFLPGGIDFADVFNLGQSIRARLLDD